MLSEWLAPGAPGQRVVFVLAHPDDEFFCLPLLAAEQRGGRAVQVVYLTDGGPLSEVRERESLRVLSGLGVAPQQVRFAGREQGWRDGKLHLELPKVRDWLAGYLEERGPCARIYVTAWEGGHHDHDCCFGVVAALLREGRAQGARGLQFPLYTGSGVPGPLFRCMAPLEQNGEVLSLRFGRREAAQYWATSSAYPSQWRTWIALGPASLGPYLVRRSVTVQQVDPSRLDQPPHEGVPYFERRFGVGAADVLRAVRGL